MKIKTTRLENFQLLKTACRDDAYQATVAAVRKVLKGESEVLFIRLHTGDHERFRNQLHVSTEFSNGVLRLGCHSFNRKNTKEILRWAGVK